jgi:hypothetical protein
MTTELMFNAVWKDLDTPQVVALLSCLVPCKEQEGARDDDLRLPLELAGAVDTLQTFAQNICAVTNVRPPSTLLLGCGGYWVQHWELMTQLMCGLPAFGL